MMCNQHYTSHQIQVYQFVHPKLEGWKVANRHTSHRRIMVYHPSLRKRAPRCIGQHGHRRNYRVILRWWSGSSFAVYSKEVLQYFAVIPWSAQSHPHTTGRLYIFRFSFQDLSTIDFKLLLAPSILLVFQSSANSPRTYGIFTRKGL